MILLSITAISSYSSFRSLVLTDPEIKETASPVKFAKFVDNTLPQSILSTKIKVFPVNEILDINLEIYSNRFVSVTRYFSSSA